MTSGTFVSSRSLSLAYTRNWLISTGVFCFKKNKKPSPIRAVAFLLGYRSRSYRPAEAAPPGPPGAPAAGRSPSGPSGPSGPGPAPQPGTRVARQPGGLLGKTKAPPQARTTRDVSQILAPICLTQQSADTELGRSSNTDAVHRPGHASAGGSRLVNPCTITRSIWFHLSLLCPSQHSILQRNTRIFLESTGESREACPGSRPGRQPRHAASPLDPCHPWSCTAGVCSLKYSVHKQAISILLLLPSINSTCFYYNKSSLARQLS